MLKGQYRPPAGYVTTSQAAERLGINPMTIRRMVKAGRLKTYADPRNGVVRLVKIEDVERLEQPVPTTE
jgi:excisionase family DNA binding protein